MEYLLLRAVGRLLRAQEMRLWFVLAAAFGAGMDLLCFFISPQPVVKALLAYAMMPLAELVICLHKRSIKEYLKAVFLFYVVALCTGGFLNWIYEQIPFVKKYGYHMMTLLCAVTFCGMCLQKASDMMKKEKLKEQCIRQVELTVNGKQIHCKGLWDTGNSLYDPISQRPVLILEKKELIRNRVEIKQQQYRIIPYHSIGRRKDFLEGFIANEVCLTDIGELGELQRMRRQNVVIGIYDGKLSKDGAYQMILHPML